MSGLGDRLIDLTMVAAYARARSMKLNVVRWPGPHPAGKDVVAHRAIDLLLGNVRAHIVFPAGVVFDDDCNGEDFPIYLGGGVSTGDFHRAFTGGGCTRDVYEKHYYEVAREFSFSDGIKAFLNGLPSNIASLHVRRGDKIRSDIQDGAVLPDSELGLLQSMSCNAIDCFINRGMNVFICGDEDNKVEPFKNYARSRGARIVEIPPSMPKWQQTYFDLAVLSRSEIIMPSHRGSNFSLFAAMIGEGKYVPVYNLSSLGC